MEEKKVTYHINGKTFNVTRKFKKNSSSTLLEKLVEYFSKYKPELEGSEEENECIADTNKQDI